MIYIVNKINYIYHLHSVGENSFRAAGSSVAVGMWLLEISHAMLKVKTSLSKIIIAKY
jgi:hypothetical protein